MSSTQTLGALLTWGEHGLELFNNIDPANASQEKPLPNYSDPTLVYKFDKPVFCAQWSKNGKFFAFASGTTFYVIDLLNLKIVHEIDVKEDGDDENTPVLIESFILSAQCSHVIIFQSYSITQQKRTDRKRGNVKLIQLNTNTEIARYEMNNKGLWSLVQFTDDDKFLVTLDSNGVLRVHELNNNILSVVSSFSQQNAKSFSLSPVRSDNKYFVVVGSPVQNGSVGFAAVYNLMSGEKISDKILMLVDSFKYSWSPLGDKVSVLFTTLVSNGDESYMADNRVTVLTTFNSSSIDLTLPNKNGNQIHKAVYDNNNGNLLVLYNKMPSRGAIFNNNLEMIIDVGKEYRNEAIFSPKGRYCAIGGHGSIPGKFSVFDINRNSIVSNVMRVQGSSKYGWSPSSKVFMMAVTTPQLRVDNAVHLFRYDGSKLWTKNYECLYGAEIAPCLDVKESIMPAWMVQKALEADELSRQGVWVPPSLRGKIKKIPGSNLVVDGPKNVKINRNERKTIPGAVVKK